MATRHAFFHNGVYHRLDEAVRRLLHTKAALGLFDDPYRGTDVAREKAVVGSRDHIALSREAGRKSVVLLKNDNGLLPLNKSQKIALIGPFADDVDNVWGPWTIWGAPERRVSLEAGFRAAMSDPQALTVARGSVRYSPRQRSISVLRQRSVPIMRVTCASMSGCIAAACACGARRRRMRRASRLRTGRLRSRVHQAAAGALS